MMWGGGMGGGGMGRGGIGGGAMGGGRGPFGGIPPEVAARARKLIDDEPDWPEEQTEFSHQGDEGRALTLRSLLARHKPALLLALVLVGAEAGIGQVGPLLTKIAIDRGIVGRDFTVLLAAALGYMAATGLSGLTSAARIAWTGRIAQWVAFDLRVRVFAHVQRLSLDFFTAERAGRIMTRMTSDIEALNQMLQNGLVQMLVQGLTTLFVTAVLFSMNVELAIFTVGIVVPVLTAATLWFRERSNKGYEQVRDGIANVLSDFQESLSGVRTIFAHRRQSYNVVAHRQVVGEYKRANVYTARLNAVYGPMSTALGLLAQAAVLLFGGDMLLHHRLSIGTLSAFVLYLTSFFAPIQQLAQLYNTYQGGSAAIAKLRGLLGTGPTVSERPGAEELPPIHGDVDFCGVCFGYEPGKPVLVDVDLHIAAGETFALVGPTGAGKSTVAKLVTRFYDPQVGRVLVDGHDLRDVKLASLRRQIGVVPQEAFLFAGTIRDNIAFARPGASDDEIWEALRAVGLGDLVERLPEGLDTTCHERGVSLSSGERQLLALARAFLARPRVLVLDEATSNLDLSSESKVEAALDVLLEGRTAILIAHRLSTAMRADRIALVEGGRVVELGSHDELVALDGRYAQMYATWVSHMAPDAA